MQSMLSADSVCQDLYPVPGAKLVSVTGELNLVNNPENFRGGKIKYCLDFWKELSSDPWIRNTVQGKDLFSFYDFPLQSHFPPPLHFSLRDSQAIDAAMDVFIQQHIVERAAGFCSNIFPRLKKDGSVRIILDLKYLNEYVEYLHFKMETLKDILPLVTDNCFFASIDL